MDEKDGEDSAMMNSETHAATSPTTITVSLPSRAAPLRHAEPPSAAPSFPQPSQHHSPPSAELARFMPEGFTAIGPIYGERKAREWSLVLQSIEIWHAVHHTQSGWVILVREHDHEKAKASIDRYEVENRDWPPRRSRERARYPESRAPIALFVALAAFFLVTGPVAAGSRWFQHGTAVTDLVLTSAPWRAVTALTLHADSAHAIGNVISGTIFVTAVSSRLGPGGGTLAVLASGVLGNVANALYQRGIGNGDHRSIGASTAIFGAIGLLAATQIGLDHAEKATAPRSLAEKLGPFIGGLALLGALGASPNADLGAHLFGFLSGLFLGLLLAFPLRWKKSTPGPWWLQASMGAAAVGVLLGSWQIAIRH